MEQRGKWKWKGYGGRRELSGECQQEEVFFFQAEDGIRDIGVTGVQTCALPISMPPTSGAERGMPKKFRNTARPSRPKTMEGTAARLLMFTSIRSVQRFLGANSSR